MSAETGLGQSLGHGPYWSLALETTGSAYECNGTTAHLLTVVESESRQELVGPT